MLNNYNKVSVIIPVYNVEGYLQKCIDSLVNQTYDNIEILLIDDGSTDMSPEICDEAASKYSNVVVIHQQNLGVSAARNKGLDIASGDYIYFVDPDDWCELNIIEILVDAVKTNSADFAYCNAYITTNDVDLSPKSMLRGLDNKPINIINKQRAILHVSQSLPLHLFGYYTCRLYTSLFKRNIIEEKMIRFDVNIRRAEDWLFFAKYLSQIEKEIVIDLPLYHYYQRQGSLINTYREITDISFQKSAYIMNQLEYTLKQSEIPVHWYQDYLNKRYALNILNTAKNIWDFRSSRTVFEKYKLILKYIEEYAPYSQINISNISGWRRLIIKYKSPLLLSLWGVLFNYAKIIRGFVNINQSEK